MTKSYLYIISVLLLIVVICSDAKEPPADLGYEPPAGWEFVMKLDSASSVVIYCHNDSCYLSVHYSGFTQKPYFRGLTIDGGETWNDIDAVPTYSFIINSMSLHRLIREDKKNYYEKSNDFYKTSEKYYINDLEFSGDTIYHSPIDPDLLITTFKNTLVTLNYTHSTMKLYISYNGGKSWSEMTNVPKQIQGLTVYKIQFDWAEKGHWFLNAKDGYDIYNDLGANFGTNHYETFDDGKTFRQIKFDPMKYDYIGFDGKYTMRALILDQYKYFDSILRVHISYYTSKGICKIKYTDTIISNEFINWLNLINPLKPNSNLDSGYVFSLNSNTFLFDYSNNSNHIIDAFEINGVDFQKRSSKDYEDYINKTQSLGKSWEIIYNAKNKPFIKNIFLDQEKKYLWIHTFDEEYFLSKEPGEYKGSLWKLKLPWESTDVKDGKVNGDGFVIYPNPAGEYISIQSSEVLKPSEGYTVHIFDLLGIEIKTLTPALSINGEGVKIDISCLQAGVYFVRIGNKLEKFVKISK